LVDLVNITDENITVRNASGEELFNTDHRYLMYSDISAVTTSGIERTPLTQSDGTQSSLDLLDTFAGYEHRIPNQVSMLRDYTNRSQLPAHDLLGPFAGPFPSLPAVFFYPVGNGETSVIQRNSTTRSLSVLSGSTFKLYGTYRWVALNETSSTQNHRLFPEMVSYTGVIPDPGATMTLELYASDVWHMVPSTGYLAVIVNPLWYDYPNQTLSLGITE
jgi:hypothetical protein